MLHTWHLCCSGVNITSGPALSLSTHNWRQAAHQKFPDHPITEEATDNKPGPGVLVYLTPMGTGQTKGASSHGWGSPLHSFWCCYGSAVESFSKVADSIFFYRCSFPCSADASILVHPKTLPCTVHGHFFMRTQTLYELPTCQQL